MKKDNYEISRERAQAYFLKFDQEQILHTWDLSCDEGYIFVRFLGKDYAINRKTGEILRSSDGAQAGFSEVLSIFDFLCHDGSERHPSGVFAPVNSLSGSPKTGGVGTDFHGHAAQILDRDPDKLKQACLKLGGTAVNMGDIGFQFPLFADLRVIMKFYHSDEDFPASVTLLWDQNLLRYIHYETVFYIAGFLLDQITREMCNDENQ